MKGISQKLCFLLGGGWWTIWYGLFYLVVLGGNLIWFGELYDWTLEGKSGPGAEAVFIGLLSLGGIPLLFFSTVHLLLACWRGVDSHTFKIVFGLIIVGLQLVWMVAGSLSIAGAVFPGFVAYYLALAAFMYVNLLLLWVIRKKLSIQLQFPFANQALSGNKNNLS